MKQQQISHHMIDVMFTIALFCVFTVSALTVIVTGANSYGNISRDTEKNYDLRTSLSYITEKVRQTDQNGSVQVGELEGVPALKLTEEVNDESYITYIYCYEDYLKELFVKADTVLKPADGKNILPIQSLDFHPLSQNLIAVDAVSPDGSSEQLLISPACKGGEAS